MGSRPTPARLTRRRVIPANTQTVAQAVTTTGGLVYVESRLGMQISHRVRLASNAQKVDRKRHFELLVANFSRVERTLPKGMSNASAHQNPLATFKPKPSVTNEIALVLNIAQVPCEDGNPTGIDLRAVDESEAVSPSENCNEEELGNRSDCTNKVDSSPIDNDAQGARILKMILTHQEMSDGHLGTT